MSAWLAAAATVGVVLAYELWLALLQRRQPQRLARSVHANLRQDWFDAVSAQKGSEILAVQTLRNAVMSATMTASTAVLGLMGTVSLAAPSLSSFIATDAAAWPLWTPRLAMELTVLALLLASLVSSAMAVRYYNHAGFVVGMPVDAPARQQWAATGTDCVRRAGLLYSWGLRQLLLVVPVVAFILHPLAGVVGALVVVLALARFDRVAVAQL
jgi:uncharacterized membrane protein